MYQSLDMFKTRILCSCRSLTYSTYQCEYAGNLCKHYILSLHFDMFKKEWSTNNIITEDEQDEEEGTIHRPDPQNFVDVGKPHCSYSPKNKKNQKLVSPLFR